MRLRGAESVVLGENTKVFVNQREPGDLSTSFGTGSGCATFLLESGCNRAGVLMRPEDGLFVVAEATSERSKSQITPEELCGRDYSKLISDTCSDAFDVLSGRQAVVARVSDFGVDIVCKGDMNAYVFDLHTGLLIYDFSSKHPLSISAGTFFGEELDRRDVVVKVLDKLSGFEPDALSYVETYLDAAKTVEIFKARVDEVLRIFGGDTPSAANPPSRLKHEFLPAALFEAGGCYPVGIVCNSGIHRLFVQPEIGHHVRSLPDTGFFSYDSRSRAMSQAFTGVSDPQHVLYRYKDESGGACNARVPQKGIPKMPNSCTFAWFDIKPQAAGATGVLG